MCVSLTQLRPNFLVINVLFNKHLLNSISKVFTDFYRIRNTDFLNNNANLIRKYTVSPLPPLTIKVVKRGQLCYGNEM